LIYLIIYFKKYIEIEFNGRNNVALQYT